MKVVGTGSPANLTVRYKHSEVRLLRDVLYEHLDVEVEAIGSRSARRSTSDPVALGEHDRGDGKVAALGALLDQLRARVTPDQARELSGPTHLLDPILRNAASEAAERFGEAVDVFRAGGGKMTADQLRSALETATASVTTLIWLDQAQDHVSAGEPR